MRRGSLAGLLIVISLMASLAPTASAADTAQVELALTDTFRFDNATLALGQLAMDGATVRTLDLVRVRSLDLPDAVLYVCEARSGQQGEIPPLPTLQSYCRDEDRYEAPDVQTGGRTWLNGRGNLTLPSPIPGTVSMVWTNGTGQVGWAGTLPPTPLAYAMADDAYAFRATRGSSEILVESAGERTWYNGTGWIFYLEGSGTLNLEAEGAHAQLPPKTPLRLSRAPLAAFQAAYEPRVLLDLQDAIEGSDAREPIGNATRVLEAYGRIPHLVDGALLGELSGTVGDRRLDRGSISLVRASHLNATVNEGMLEGEGEILFIRSGEGFSVGTGAPAGVPWLLSGLFWLGAAAAVVLRDRAKRPSWHRWVGPTIGIAAFLVWDLVLQGLIGTSALALLGEEAKAGVLLALLGFELIALSLTWALIYLPLRIGLENGLPERFEPWARPGLGLASLIAIWITPGTLLVIGQLVARL